MLRSFAKIGWLCVLGALLLLPSSASAQSVTTTFNGTVVLNAADGFSSDSTGDFADPFSFYPNGPFGGNGGSLVGMPFQLTLTMNVSDPSSPSWDGVGIGNANFYTGSTGYQGGYPYGGYYGCCSPMTASLTINNNTVVFDDRTGQLPQYFNISSDGFTGPSELSQQAFYWFPCCGYGVQYFGLLVDLTSSTGVFGSDFTTPLPTLQAGTDFNIAYAAFYTFGGEYQNLGVENVNGPSFLTPSVPEPATWLMMTIGFTALGIAGFRRRLDAKVAFST